MSKLWQLKKLSTGEALNEPQLLPENWGPIFGLHGFLDKIGDLGAWLGPPYEDMGWVVVGESIDPVTASNHNLQWNRAKQMLQESDWSMLPDVPLTREQKARWIEYRRALREIRLQPGFPDNIQWPVRPE